MTINRHQTDAVLNGNDLPADRIKQVEAGLTLFQQIQAERDALRDELREANEIITRQRVEIESLNQLHNMLESHIQTYMVQRDDAVAQRAAYETLFATVQAQLRVFNLPSTPLVKGAVNAVQDREPVHSDRLADVNPAPDFGGRQQSTMPDPSAGAGKVRARSSVLAHDQSVLGQHPGHARPPRLRSADPSAD